jgi:hypothetical protein
MRYGKIWKADRRYGEEGSITITTTTTTTILLLEGNIFNSNFFV